MWFDPLNHGRNKAWLEEEKLSRASRARAELLSDEYPKADTGVAVRMKSRGFGWEDGKITDVLQDDRVTGLWESGAITTILERKVALALNATHVFHGMNKLGVPEDSEERRTDASRKHPPQPQ